MSSADEPIGALLTRLATGDGDALSALYDHLAPRVWAIARTVTGSPERAEAVTVQVFRDMWHQAADCPADPDAMLEWALGIAVRRACAPTPTPTPRRRRENSSAHRRHGSNGRKTSAIDSRSPSDRDESVAAALGTLPQEQRDALLLSCCGRLSLGQLARTLHIDRQDAAKVLVEGLVRFRDQLAIGDRPLRAVHG